MAKQKNVTAGWIGGAGIAIIAVFVVLALTGVVNIGIGEQAITGAIVDESGQTIGKWSDTIVSYELITENPEGTDVAATAKVYEVKPTGFDDKNGREEYDDATEYTQYSAADGIVDINSLYPGDYFVVIEASGYNTEFLEISIPDGSEPQYRTTELTDYEASPKTTAVRMLAVGSTTDEDFAFTLVNDTNADISEQITLKVAELTEFRGFRAVITDEEGFSTDADSDNTYDEGVKEYEVQIEDKKLLVFKPATGIDEFDDADKAYLDLSDVVVQSKDFMNVGVEIVANTEDGTTVAANDELWSEGEGVLSYIYIYDNEGNLFATVDVTA